LEESLAKLDELGGPNTFNHYPWGWTRAGNTPFRRWKRETYRGGASDPFLVHRPAGMTARGEVRQQYAHIIDMVPTVLDVLGLEPPTAIRGVTQSPLHGVSFAHTFDDADAATRHHTQYFEMFGHRAIDHDGWRAVCPWPGPSFAEAGLPFGTPITADTLAMLDADRWELYHAAEDFSENYDVAAQNRGRLIELIAQWADRAVVRRGRTLRGAPHRRRRRHPADDRAPAAHPGADELHLLAGHRVARAEALQFRGDLTVEVGLRKS
jgi:arylsulfatase